MNRSSSFASPPSCAPASPTPKPPATTARNPRTTNAPRHKIRFSVPFTRPPAGSRHADPEKAYHRLQQSSDTGYYAWFAVLITGRPRIGESLMRFPVVIHKDETSGYGITVPDLPGCFSAGDSIEEAIPSGHEAIACHLGGASPGPGADPGTGPAGDTSGQRGVQRRNLGTDRVRCLEGSRAGPDARKPHGTRARAGQDGCARRREPFGPARACGALLRGASVYAMTLESVDHPDCLDASRGVSQSFYDVG